MRFFFVIILVISNVVNAQLTFEFRWGEQKIIPEKTYYYKSDSIQFEELKAYLSDIYIESQERRQKIADVWLINFEDALSTSLNTTLEDEFPRTVFFNFGLDSIYHVNMDYTGDLDPVHGMYWAWNTGYINFKMVARCSNAASKNGRVDYHLGGYYKPNQTTHPIEFKMRSSTILLDLLPLFDKDIIRPEVISSIVLPGKEANRLMKFLSNTFRHD